MSNCRSIEVDVLYPAGSDLTSSLEIFPPSKNSTSEVVKVEGCDFSEVLSEMDDQGPVQFPGDTSLANSSSSHDLTPASSPPEEIFRFLDLPIELRLKIYRYLLPPRAWKISTQIPHNGFFYNTSTIPLHSVSSFYPFGTTAPNPSKNKLTTYKILNSNFRSEYPLPSVHPQILLLSKQVKEEALPVLYGGKGASFDFGIHIEAALAFFTDRGREARGAVKEVRVAREIPCVENSDGLVAKPVDNLWVRFCGFLEKEMKGVRGLDLTIWSSSGSVTSFPARVVSTAPTSTPTPAGETYGASGVPAGAIGSRDGEEEVLKAKEKELQTQLKWREWEWTRDLLRMEALRKAKVTWWGFEGQDGGFDSWLAGRMVGDRLVRERMIREGMVVEGFVVIPGKGA
jgi:hypothetical protein